MSPIKITLITWACLFCGMQVGNLIRRYCQERYLSGNARAAISSGSAVIGTLAAIVLGLMVSSASKNYDGMNDGITMNAASYIDLDRVLAQYGPDANATRDLLRGAVEAEINRIWPTDDAGTLPISYSPKLEDLAGSLRKLHPQDESQTILKSRAMQLLSVALEQRWQIVARSQIHVPISFLVIVVCWFAVLFCIFQLLAPPANPIVSFFMLFCTIAVAGGLYLVVNLSQPFSGFIQLNREPMHAALNLLGH